MKLEVIPFGDEDKAYEIGRLDIFNKGKWDKGAGASRYEYGVIELGKEPGLYKKTVKHYREDGAWELLARVLEELEIEGPK